MEESTAFKLLGQALRHEADLADEWKHTSDQLWDGVKRGSVDVIKNKDYNIQDDDFRALLPMPPYAAYLLKFIAKDISSTQGMKTKPTSSGLLSTLRLSTVNGTI